MLWRKLIFGVLEKTHFWGVLGAWMTFKKPEMDKILMNGLSMSKTDPLNHKWLDFAIYSGLALHQFQRKLLLRYFFYVHNRKDYSCFYSLGLKAYLQFTSVMSR